MFGKLGDKIANNPIFIMGAYILSFLIILILVIVILIYNGKKHSRIFDDVNGLIRIDTKEGRLIIGLLSIIAYILFYVIFFSVPSTNPVKQIIPQIAESTQIEEYHVNGIIEMVIIAIAIFSLNWYHHKKMFTDSIYDPKTKHTIQGKVRTDTDEGIATIVLLSFISFVLFYFILKYLEKGQPLIEYFTNVLEPINLAMYVLVMSLLLIIWILQTFYQRVMNIFTKSDTNGISEVFSDFDRKYIPNYGVIFTMLIIIAVVLYVAAYDSKSLTTYTYVYIFTILVPCVFVFYYGLPFIISDPSGSGVGKVGILIGMGLLVAAAIYFYININSTLFKGVGIITTILTVLIIIFGLALFFYLLSNYLKTFSGWSGFIIYFIFYIPCLLIDFFRYMMKESQLTSKVVYILFFIEIALILLYNYLPGFISYIDKKDGVLLLQDGSFLDNELSLGSSEILQIPENKLENTIISTVYYTNFAFSMWVYLNIQPANFSSYSKETTIFNCGNGKPRLVYYNDVSNDAHKNKYKVYFTAVGNSGENCDNCFEIMLPNQKWNNFVFNYKSEQVDLFVNGDLVKVFTFNSHNRPNYFPADDIVVGSEDGLDGAICNVRFYSTNLTTSRITSMYNLLMYKNPPTMV
jgi:hypothetical protein